MERQKHPTVTDIFADHFAQLTHLRPTEEAFWRRGKTSSRKPQVQLHAEI